MSEIISKKTRLEFREYFVGTTLREITQEFDAVDVPFDADYTPSESGQRRSLVEQYYHAIDFTSWRDVRNVIRVYESVLVSLEEAVKGPAWGQKNEYAERTMSTLVKCLERDGFNYTDGRISSIGHHPTMDQLVETAHLLDAHALRQQIDRIRNAIDEDPCLAIGTAKELLETTCKTILADFGLETNINWDLTRLVKETRSALHLVPEDVPDGVKGAEIVKRVLGNLGQIAQGVAELRNLYGTGHGRDGRFRGLSPRHARLAVACSTALATFLFETYDARHERAD